MERLDHAHQVWVLHIQQVGTIMEQSHKYIIILPTEINCRQIQDLGKTKTYEEFYLKFYSAVIVEVVISMVKFRRSHQCGKL
jgi:hypothetical protein